MSTALPGGGHLFRLDQLETVDRGAGISSVPLVGGSFGASALSTGMTLIPPGGGIPLHTHDVEESVVLLEGSAEVEVDGEIFRIKKLDTTYMPAGVPHCFRNTGEGVLRILWVYPSISATRTLAGTGQVMDHLGRYE